MVCFLLSFLFLNYFFVFKNLLLIAAAVKTLIDLLKVFVFDFVGAGCVCVIAVFMGVVVVRLSIY